MHSQYAEETEKVMRDSTEGTETSWSFKYLSGFLSPNWPVSIVVVCSCLFAGLCLNIHREVKQVELPGNYMASW